MLRFELLQHLSGAGDRATGADATDENVDLAVGVFPKLDGGGPPVDLRVGRVLELLRHPGVRRFGDDLLGSAHGAGHPLGRRGEHQFRAIAEKQDATFQAHALRHRQDEPVTLRRGDPGECDARVAAGRLDDGGHARLDQSSGLGILDHRHADAVLDRITRSEGLDLADEDARRGSPPNRDNRTSGVLPISSRRVFGDGRTLATRREAQYQRRCAGPSRRVCHDGHMLLVIQCLGQISSAGILELLIKFSNERLGFCLTPGLSTGSLCRRSDRSRPDSHARCPAKQRHPHSAPSSRWGRSP